jgi:hypothetical protein
MRDQEIDRLITELEAIDHHGWRYTYEYPGLFCYSHPDGGPRVFFTPDWDEDATLVVEVQNDDGTCIDYERHALPRDGRTGRKLFDLVRPTLDKHHPENKS